MAGKAGKSGGRPSGSSRPQIIIRKEEIVEGGHHGGAWKVAYADFVTAMMAFFLLMWLINATTEDQRRGIAAYFSPMAKIENGFSGSGMIPGGLSPVADGAQLVDQGPTQLATLAAHGDTSKTDNDGEPDTGDAQKLASSPASIVPDPGALPQAPNQSSQATEAQAAAAPDGTAGSGEPFKSPAAEEQALEGAARGLRDAVANDHSLAGVAGQMAIDVTPEGLRIQIMDAEHQSMFDRGSTIPNQHAAALLRIATRYLIGLPEPISIGGHTDAAPYRPGELSNWSLSSGRADAARNILVMAGLPDSRLSNVTGYADRKLLLPADPLAPANRRIVLTLHRTWPQADHGPRPR